MSLESQIADLVSATNGLITAFNTKKAGIDASVATALQTIPNNSRTYYVDSVAGDDTAAGTQAAPIKTIKKAIDLVPVGGNGQIYLKCDGTYPVDSFVTVMNKSIYIDSYSAGAKPIIAPVAFVYDGTNSCYGFQMFSSQMRFVRAKIKTPGLADVGLPVGTLNSVFVRSDTGVVGDVTLSICDIDLDKCNLFRASFATTMFRAGLYSVTVTRTSTDGKLLVIDAGVANLGVSSLTLPSGTVLADLISGIVRDAGNVPRNLACNTVL